jgi:tetratricopeptide (TPR) repeat protein
VNFTLIGTIATRFLRGGSGFVELVALIFPAMVSLFQAQNALTDAGQKGFARLMKGLKIPPYLYEEVQFLTTMIITLLLLSIWVNFPTFSEIYKRQGKKYQDNQRFAQAEQNYLKAIELEPNNLDVHYKLATLYEDLQDFDNAKKQYLIAAKGGHLDAYNNLSYRYLRENKDAEAVELLQKGRSILAEKDNELEQLTEDEKRTLEVQKYYIYKNLGWARLKQNRTDDAIPNLLIAMGIAQDPANQQYIRNPWATYCLYAQVLQKQMAQLSQITPYWHQCIQLIESHTSEITNFEEDQWLYEAKKQLP